MAVCHGIAQTGSFPQWAEDQPKTLEGSTALTGLRRAVGPDTTSDGGHAAGNGEGHSTWGPCSDSGDRGQEGQLLPEVALGRCVRGAKPQERRRGYGALVEIRSRGRGGKCQHTIVKHIQRKSG